MEVGYDLPIVISVREPTHGDLPHSLVEWVEIRWRIDEDVEYGKNHSVESGGLFISPLRILVKSSFILKVDSPHYSY